MDNPLRTHIMKKKLGVTKAVCRNYRRKKNLITVFSFIYGILSGMLFYICVLYSCCRRSMRERATVQLSSV